MASATDSTFNFSTGELICTNATTWYQISATQQGCQRIRISAPNTHSPYGQTNVNDIMIVESLTTPATTAGAFVLPNTATGISYVLVNDPRHLWCYAINAGDRVEYSIQGVQ